MYWACTLDRGHDRASVELSRAARLRGRPLRRAGGAPGRRRGLQPGDRLRAPPRHPPQLRAGPVQPAADKQPCRPEAVVGGLGHLHREPGGPSWNGATSTASSPWNCRAAIGSPSATAAPTSSCRCRFRSPRRSSCPGEATTMRAGRVELHARSAVAAFRDRVGRIWHVLRRHKNRAGASDGTRELHAAGARRAHGLRQPRGSAAGRVHDAPRGIAHHVHSDAADVRERPGPVQLEHQRRWRPTSGWRWEYQPGSELFVVFNDQQDTLDARIP